jgi:hypothetical protein
MAASPRADLSLLVVALILAGSMLAGCRPAGPGTDGSTVDDCENPPCDAPDDPPVVSGGGAANDKCEDAVAISGAVEAAFDLSLSTSDGPAHAACSNEGSDQIDNDVWYCWTADCDGVAVVHTCGLTEVDTRVAVYEGCACPPTDAGLLACADDGCGVQTRTTFAAEAGVSYLVRVGIFPPTDAGPGGVRISCGFPACPAEGSCDQANEGPGCADADCCNTVCAVDSMCCDEAWDDWCADEAAGLCGGGFASCGTGEACTTAHEAGGCADAQCCNNVCATDPYCCLTKWDETCVELEATKCFAACTASAGDCATPHASAGCANRDCCAEVCPRDAFCCTTEWDSACASVAVEVCE